MAGPSARVRGFLLAALAQATQRRYLAALALFDDWCAQVDFSWRSMVAEEQDWVAAEYVLHLFDDDAPVAVARDAIAGLQRMYPGRRYVTAWRVVTGWALRAPPVRAPPLPARLLCAAVTLLAAAGKHSVALSLLLAFTGLLRIGEVLQLRLRDVRLTLDGVVLLLPRTKTGPHQRVHVQSLCVGRFLRAFLKLHPKELDNRLCDVSYGIVGRWLRRSTAVLGYENVAFRSHSLRRGGATQLFIDGAELSRIMIYGRWQNERSCRLYIQSAEAELLSLENAVSPALQSRIRALASLTPLSLDLPLGEPDGGR